MMLAMSKPQRLIINNVKLLDLIKSSYTAKDIQTIFDFLQQQETFNFPKLETGLFSAAILNKKIKSTAIGMDNAWIRDNIHIAHAHYIRGETDVAIRNLTSLMDFLKKSQFRFERVIEAQVDPDQAMERPHIRFDGINLAELEQQWGHAQNDALGYFLWFYCKLAKEGYLKPEPEDLEILALFPFYFQAIRYWDDKDNGHWEEEAKVEASSIGVVIAGLKELKQLLIQEKTLASACKYQDTPVSIQFLEKLITQGKITLNHILPAECIQPETKKRRYDAALLFLIYPLQVIDDEISDQILRNVINNLQGDYGIKRYLEDSYWCADYKQKLEPETRTSDFSNDMASRDALLKKGEEAQWCIFDPIISIIFGLKFEKTRQEKYRQQQIYYLNRSLGQLTDEDCPFGEFKCPELYYLENSRYVPNPHTPLLWTQANLSIALKMMEVKEL